MKDGAHRCTYLKTNVAVHLPTPDNQIDGYENLVYLGRQYHCVLHRGAYLPDTDIDELGHIHTNMTARFFDMARNISSTGSMGSEEEAILVDFFKRIPN